MRIPIEFQGVVANDKRINTKTGKKMHVVTISFMGGSHDFFFPDEMLPDVLMGNSVRVSCLFNLAKFRLEDVKVRSE